MTDLKSEDSASQIDTILERAWSLCRRELAAAPDSLGLSQHVGVLALAAGRTEDALAQFDAILALSPNDPYALFGKGLAASDAALLGEAARRDGEAMTYFMDFPVRVPAPTPMEEEPKSRWEKRPNPKFDTRAKKISEPSDEQMEDLLEHFGRRRTPVGEALLNCLVGSGGGVSDCVIVDEAPFNQGVGEFALRMAMLSKFEPARLNGEPVDRVPVNYKIRLVDANGEAPNVRTGSLGELIEGLTKETREKKAAAPSAASEPDSAPRRAGTPVPRVLNEETRRMLARTDCEVMFEEMRSPKDGQDIGDRMARADSFCRRELEKAPDSLMLRQHVAIVALAAGKPAEAAQAFDEILALSPNDPYALYGRGIAAFNLDASADLSMMAEAQKREPEVRAYFSKLLVTIPDVAPQEEEPKSRHERRPVPAYDTRTKQLSDPTDQQMRDLLMHFGVRRTPVGEAQLNCLVGADGSVFECVVIKETPFNQGVGEFAIRIAMASKFEPATLNGEAVDRVPLNYTLSLVEDPESLTPK